MEEMKKQTNFLLICDIRKGQHYKILETDCTAKTQYPRFPSFRASVQEDAQNEN